MIMRILMVLTKTATTTTTTKIYVQRNEMKRINGEHKWIVIFHKIN